MTEQELREKIAHIIAKKLCPNKNRHFALWGDEAHCYSRENFAECEVIADTVDALIEAGIGDVSELQKKLDAYRISYTRFFYELTSNKKFIEKVIKTSWGCKMQIFEDFLEKAERELQEEKKDESRHRCY